MIAQTVSFDIDFTDRFTDQKFVGTFKAKTRLTQREMLAEGELSRKLLGYNPKEAEPEDKQRAGAIAYCVTRITDAPKWWKDANSGLEIESTELIADVYNQCEAAISVEYDKLTEKAEEARKEIKAEVK